MDPNGKTAVVIGGSGALPLAVIEALGAAGAQVLRIANPGVEAQAAPGTFIQCDLASGTALEAVFSEIRARFGVPQILVNCSNRYAVAETLPARGVADLQFFRDLLRDNLYVPFNALRLFAQAVADGFGESSAEQAVVINHGSVLADEGLDFQAAYCAAKGGIAGLTLPAARELSKFGIRVQTIATGAMACDSAGLIEIEQQHLLPARSGRPDEFASLCLEIIGNPMVNGGTWRLDAAARVRRVGPIPSPVGG